MNDQSIWNPPSEVLAVNIFSDLGGSFNGYTYSNNIGLCTSPATLEERRAGTPACGVNYGIGMYSMALTTRTVIRLECIDYASDLMQMYVRGISAWDTALTAAGTFDTSSIECSLSPCFEPQVSATGTDCLGIDDGQHTYWKVGTYALPEYNSGRTINWALYGPGSTYTLRHCSGGEGSGGNGGNTHFKGSIWIVNEPSC